jgi:hypothetical protein
MPYFKNDTVNTLFIHIPKTGGTAVEHYLSSLYNIPLSRSTLYYFDKTFSHVSLQHQMLSSILQHRSRFAINVSQLMKFTVVRDPYTRLISDLFFYKLITGTEPTAIITNRIKSYIRRFIKAPTALDNHIRPQHHFLIVDRQIDPSIKILRHESLASDMNAIGFKNFPMKKESSCNYYNLLTFETVKLINTIYKQDFVHFGYDMILSNEALKQKQTINTPKRVSKPVPSPIKNQQPRVLPRIFFPNRLP